MEDLLRRSLQTIRTLKANCQRVTEPIAILGMSCRFPGGCTTPEAFWELLCNKGDGIRDVPPERWDIDEFHDPKPGTPGKMYIRQANFLQEDVSKFDARFFRISPLEAMEMDPQQRILLELGWEALERAGQNIEGLKGSRTGVFIGIIGSDYSRLPRDPSKVNPYRGTGSIPSIASGRIAHVLGLHGPALSVDTTCSSSLVSLQLACDSLHRNKCRMALAGGVNMMLSPNPMISLCMMNALSTDGRCRPFDGDGQGYGRAEGAGLVVLKRLSLAIEDNDPVLAVIRSTAVNQDGPSSGLTVPNGNAQRELIREALADADLKGEDISYLESHGTGTALGDPIEIKAVRQVLGENRTDDNPLLIGSVKGNVGHLEGAAGICGLIKVVLCLQNRQIPANINLTSLNPRVPLQQIPARIPANLTDWTPSNNRPRLAGISSFGFSGTNAHAILAEAPKCPQAALVAESSRPLTVLKISAKTEWALQRLRQSYAAHLASNPDLSIDELCYTANVCRSDFPLRACYIAGDIASMQQQLEQPLQQDRKNLDEGDSSTEVMKGSKIAFLFSDKALSHSRDIYDHSVQYRRYFDQCNELLTPRIGGSLEDTVFAMDEADLAPLARKAALFASQYAMAMYLRSINIEPSAVWAQSQAGTYAAACAADILLLEDAVSLILDPERTRLESLQAPRCRFLAPDTGLALQKSQLMSSAFWRALNPTGVEASVVAAKLRREDYRLLLLLGEEPKADSNDRVMGIQGDREGFMRGLGALYSAGVNIDWSALYQGQALPHKILLPTYPFERRRYWGPLKPTAAAPGEQPGRQAGVEVDVDSLPNGEAKERIDSGGQILSEPDRRFDLQVGTEDAGAALQGQIVESPIQGDCSEFALTLSLGRLPEARDTHGILHVGYYQEILKRAIRDRFSAHTYRVGQIRFLSALILSEEDVDVRLVFEPIDKESTAFRFFSQSAPAEPWEKHVEGRLLAVPAQALDSVPVDTIDAAQKRSIDHYRGDEFYRRLLQRDIRLGPAVQWVDEVWRTSGEALVRFKKPAQTNRDGDHALGFHPGVLDACAQLFHAALFDDAPADRKFMVVEWQDCTYHRPPQDDQLWCHVLLEHTDASPGAIVGSFELFDKTGRLVVSAVRCEMKGLKGFNVRELKKIRQEVRMQSSNTSTAVLQQIEAASGADRVVLLVAWLRQVTAEVLGIPIDDIRPGDTLMDLGIDSMSGVMLQAAIDRDLGTAPALDVIIQGPDLHKLAREIVDKLPRVSTSALATADHTVPTDSPSAESIALRTNGATEAVSGKAKASHQAAQLALTMRTDTLDTPNNIDAQIPRPASINGIQSDADLWFTRSTSVNGAKARLFCLPYGGGGASIYTQWGALLGDTVDVCPIQLPHRENRLKEQPITDIGTMVDQLAQHLQSRLDLPFAFYGHSMGALIAYRLTCRLWWSSNPKPSHLFVGGFSSPLIYPNPLLARTRQKLLSIGLSDIPDIATVSTMPEQQLRSFAEVFTGFKRIPDSEHELRELLLPIFAGDLQLVSSFAPQAEKALGVAITAFHGKDDTEVMPHEMQAWKNLTDGPFEFHELTGDHLFLQQNQSQARLLDLIARQLARMGVAGVSTHA